jgi:hypothetical protein
LFTYEDDLQRWARAGQTMRKLLFASGSSRIKQESSSSPEDGVVPERPNVVEYTRNEDVEVPEIGSAVRVSEKDPKATSRISDNIIAWPLLLSEKDTLLSIHKPSNLLQWWEDESNDDCAEAEAVIRLGILKKLISSRAKNFQDKAANAAFQALSLGRLFGVHGKSIWIVLVFGLTSAYGGIHMVAWNYACPSVVECWLWRSSCIALVSFTWPLGLKECLVQLSCRLAGSRMGRSGGLGISGLLRSLVGFCGLSFSFIVAVLHLVVIMACAFARIFIVVESFISFRSVPIGVYATIPWANCIPHI